MEGGQHQRCYARALGGCSSKISLEHPLSKAVLRIVAVDGKVEMRGLPGFSEGERRMLPVATLGTNVLCTAHNERLSGLDAVAGKFMAALSDGLLDRGPKGFQWFEG